MAFATKQRMKVLPSVTVHGLEAALEKGFSQVGHRCLTPFIPLLSKMTWKTAASSHLNAFVALEAILFFSAVGMCQRIDSRHVARQSI